MGRGAEGETGCVSEATEHEDPAVDLGTFPGGDGEPGKQDGCDQQVAEAGGQQCEASAITPGEMMRFSQRPAAGGPGRLGWIVKVHI